MNQQGARWKIVAVIVVLIAVAGGAGYGWLRNSQKAQIRAYVPEVPTASLNNDLLQARLEDATDRALNGPDPVEALDELAAVYQANWQLDPAETALEGLIELRGDAKHWYRLAALYESQSDFEAALGVLQTVVELAPAYAPAQLRIAKIHVAQNELQAAREAYAAALKIAPQNGPALVGLARIAMRDEDWAQARKDLEQAVANDPTDGTAWSALSSVYDRLELPEQAAEARRETAANPAGGEYSDPWTDELALYSYDVYQLRVSASSVRAAGNRELALKLFQRALSLDPQNAQLHRELAMHLSSMGEDEKALSQFRKAAELEPEDSDNWSYMSQFLHERGLEQEAEDAVWKGLSYNPESPPLLMYKGKLLADDGHFAAALQAFEKSRDLRPTEVSAYIQIAQMHFRLNQIDEGIAAMEEALKVEPDHPLALTTLAIHAIGEGDRERAEKWLQQAKAQYRVPREDVAEIEHRFQMRFGAL
ncbi:MAG: hypothetical protein E1N59_50 [Puniceicoccaceae bacterium 5H]|nr:MAG: hypothetical protein E1N59_50 [Puniceicoccaceae bacterium 5H]